MPHYRAFLFAVAGFVGMGAARAAFTVVLEPASQSALPGGEAVFSGAVVNTSPTDKLFLNDIEIVINGAPAALTPKPNTFFAHVPGILLPGEIYRGPLFKIAVKPGAAAADFSGSVALRGGADIFATAEIANADFAFTVQTAFVPHSADGDRNFRISLLELTRVIELYNSRGGTTRTGCYAVEATSEDGFAPDPFCASGGTLSRYHAADANRDARLNLVELTRVIELYNYRAGTTRTGQYHVQAGTEDGFAPGP